MLAHKKDLGPKVIPVEYRYLEQYQVRTSNVHRGSQGSHQVKVPTNISELLRKMRANADLMSRNFSFSCYQILMIYTTVKDTSR